MTQLIEGANPRISFLSLELTTSQKIVFANWEAGFDAHDAGVSRDRCPFFGKSSTVWRQGWDASAAVDRISEQL